MGRTASIRRTTSETEIQLDLDLDGSGQGQIATGVGFFDHMLELFAKHAVVDLSVAAKGDLHIDAHHTVEDIGICLGLALVSAVADKRGIRRYGHFTLPMDETLVSTAIDLSGRSALVYRVAMPTPKVGEFDTELIHEFWQAVVGNGLLNLHVVLHHGQNTHHICEAIFKSAARSLRQAVEMDPRQSGVPSTKGQLGESID